MYEPLGVVRPIRTLIGGPGGGLLAAPVAGAAALAAGAGALGCAAAVGAGALAPLASAAAAGLLAGALGAGAAGEAQAPTSSTSAAAPAIRAVLALAGCPEPYRRAIPLAWLIVAPPSRGSAPPTSPDARPGEAGRGLVPRRLAELLAE